MSFSFWVFTRLIYGVTYFVFVSAVNNFCAALYIVVLSVVIFFFFSILIVVRFSEVIGIFIIIFGIASRRRFVFFIIFCASRFMV